jgi:hypothetical protein
MAREDRLHLRLHDKTRLFDRGTSAVSWARHLSLPVLRKLAPDNSEVQKAHVHKSTATKIL